MTGHQRAVLLAAVHDQPHAVTWQDRDRTDTARDLWAAGVCVEDIADICGVPVDRVEDVLDGKAVR